MFFPVLYGNFSNNCVVILIGNINFMTVLRNGVRMRLT